MSDKSILYGINQRIALRRLFCEDAKALKVWKVLGPSAKALLLDMISFNFMEENFPFEVEGTGKRREVKIQFKWDTGLGAGKRIVINRTLPIAKFENVST